MELLDAERSILVIIDLQGKLVTQVHRPQLTLAANLRLLRIADLFGVPVVLTEQYPEGLGATHPQILELFESLSVARRRVKKTTFGCCGEPAFEAALTALRPALPHRERQLLVGGIEAHVCVMQTVLEALRSGQQVHVACESTSGRGAERRQHAFERMRQAGAVLTNDESAGFEWARHKDHPRFKAFSRLLKEGPLPA